MVYSFLHLFAYPYIFSLGLKYVDIEDVRNYNNRSYSITSNYTEIVLNNLSYSSISINFLLLSLPFLNSSANIFHNNPKSIFISFIIR